MKYDSATSDLSSVSIVETSKSCSVPGENPSSSGPADNAVASGHLTAKPPPSRSILGFDIVKYVLFADIMIVFVLSWN